MDTKSAACRSEATTLKPLTGAACSQYTLLEIFECYFLYRHASFAIGK